MPIRTALRIMPAAWFAIPIAGIAAWYASLLPSPPGYGLAATAAASGAMPLISAFVAGTSAWEGARLRRSRIWGGPWVRRSLYIAGRLLVVPIAAGIVSAGCAVAVAHIRAGAFPPDPVIVAVVILDIITYASVGFALGILAPPALAVPVAAVLPVLWLAFVPAMYPVWLRHLAGMYRDCCSLDQTLAPQAAVASVSMDIAFMLAATVACLVDWRLVQRVTGSALALAAGALIGIPLASSLTFAPAVARDTSLLSCAPAGGAEVCLWPEHSAAASQIQATVARVYSKWLAIGIDAPSTFTEASGVPAPGTIQVHFQEPFTVDAVTLALADGMLPAFGGCGRATTGGVAVPYLEAWYAAAGGMSQSALQTLDSPGYDGNPSVLAVVHDLTEASQTARRSWEARVSAIVLSCDGAIPDLRVRG